jgi:hypothetical protein
MWIMNSRLADANIGSVYTTEILAKEKNAI